MTSATIAMSAPEPHTLTALNSSDTPTADISQSRLWLFRVLLILLGLGLGGLVIELGLRIVHGLRGSQTDAASELRGLCRFRPDLPWLFELRPNAEGRISGEGAAFYRINADGWRDTVYARPKPDGIFRILVMGDSVSFGYGVEEAEAYPQVLEELLAETVPDRRIEVVNLGVGGYNAYNEAKLLEGVGLSYQPDLVLVQFCINDLNDPTLHFDAQTRLALSAIPDAAFPDPSKRRGSAHAPSRTLRWCQVSRLCTVVQDLWLAMTALEFDEQTRRDAVTFVEGMNRPEWRWLEARYQEMAETANEGGASFAILAFPYQKQLTERPPHPVQAQLIAFGEQHDWRVIDPLDAFVQAYSEGSPVFFDWWHPTPIGHRITAKSITRALACGGELGAEARRTCLASPSRD